MLVAANSQPFEGTTSHEALPQTPPGRSGTSLPLAWTTPLEQGENSLSPCDPIDAVRRRFTVPSATNPIDQGSVLGCEAVGRDNAA